MTRYLLLKLVVVGLCLMVSCGKKSETITQENLREVLTRYAKENPENEVLIETDLGNMRIRLYEETAMHRANFIKLIKEDHYKDADFYRVFYQFMIQGGDLKNQFNYRIPAEFNPKYFHKKGALSMAREDEDNPELESSSTEFFIVHGGKYNERQVDEEAANLQLDLSAEQRQAYTTTGGYMSLDRQYTVFGEVIEGIEVIDRIARVKVYDEDKPLRKIPFRISVVETSQ